MNGYFDNGDALDEIWMPVPGYEGIYMASTHSRIKSVNRNIIRPNGVIVSCKGVMLYQRFKEKVGYLCVELSKNNKRKQWLVHRVLALTFIPNPLCLPVVNHKDGDKINNAISNLEWCSNSFNQLHAYKNGLRKPMVNNKFSAKLTTELVGIIRQRIKKGELQKHIAKDYGVSISAISYIKNNKKWK